jgi:alkylhydroperoxidase family enzyme
MEPGIRLRRGCVFGRIRNSGLEHSLLELVKMRASQINGCAYYLGIAGNRRNDTYLTQRKGV